MKTLIYSLWAALIIGFSIYSCQKENTGVIPPDFKGLLISKSDCKKDFKSTNEKVGTPDSLSCVNYSFDAATNNLTIKHINAGFNCCPDSVYCDISLKGDTIIIQEKEKVPQCHCDCLYDLNIEVQGVSSRKYQVKLIEPYVEGATQILFAIDLAKDPSGSYCVTRKYYPWGVRSFSN